MITAKNAVFIGLQLENCCLVVGGLSFGGGVYWEEFYEIHSLNFAFFDFWYKKVLGEMF